MFSKIGTAEVATDPMPPSVADTFVMLKPRDALAGSAQAQGASCVAELEAAVRQLPGNNYEFTQPIQMRMNELISGVRADVAVKVYGDDLETLVIGWRARRRDRCATVPGAADVRVEQATGLPMLTITPDREALARYGLNPARRAGHGGHRGRRAPWPGSCSKAIGASTSWCACRKHLRQRPGCAGRPADSAARRQATRTKSSRGANWAGGEPQFVPLREVAKIEEPPGPNQINRENGKRRVVVTANVRGRDLGCFVAEAACSASMRDVKVPTGYWIEYGGTFEQLDLGQPAPERSWCR